MGVGRHACVFVCVLLLCELGSAGVYLCIYFSVSFTCDGECECLESIHKKQQFQKKCVALLILPFYSDAMQIFFLRPFVS